MKIDSKSAGLQAIGVLDNPIERSSKAWGLGQNAKICFPPARGAHFSIKCGQNAGLGQSALRGRPPGSEGLASGSLLFRLFFVTSKLYRFLSKKTSQKVRKSRILASKNHSKTLPKSIPNRCSKIYVLFQRIFANLWVLSLCANLLRSVKNLAKTVVLQHYEHVDAILSLVHDAFKKCFKNLPKTL